MKTNKFAMRAPRQLRHLLSDSIYSIGFCEYVQRQTKVAKAHIANWANRNDKQAFDNA